MGKARKIGKAFLLSMLVSTLPVSAQMKAGQIDIFAGVDLNYRDINYNNRVFDVLVNLTPGVKWNMGHRWEAAAQVYVPVVNQYGDRYGKIRLNMASLSKQWVIGNRWKAKVSGGLFGAERYGIDIKNMLIVNRWLAVKAQVGLTGYCSMANGWEASTMGRITGQVGPDIYLHKWNTEISILGGRYLYSDYGIQGECFRHFKHVSVGLFGSYSDKAKENGGFTVVVMLPPYKRNRHKVNFRPASNFRQSYNIEADSYGMQRYKTDPEENEREGWFDHDLLPWGAELMPPDYLYKDNSKKGVER